MSIISKETFEKFTKEEKENVFLTYKYLTKKGSYNGIYTDEEVNGAMQLMTTLFGKENLQLEPKIKTWADVIANNIHDVFDDYVLVRNCVDCHSKLLQKLEAALKIAKLIELGYGGIITDEEWKDSNTLKHVVYCTTNNRLHIQSQYTPFKHFISFHTKQQAEEFMSYPENVKLVEQYYMI